MKFAAGVTLASIFLSNSSVDAQGQMVKMCLFYPNPSGHARSDPIVSTTCPSDHVHTFYGPLEFHPDTSYQNLLDVIQTPSMSSSPFVENQSLYWHPSIYRVSTSGDGTETYTRVSNLDSSPYYRWDKSVTPLVKAFPAGFRMIAGTTDANSNSGGELGANMLTECCDLANGEESCVSWDRLNFPSRSCDFLGIAFSMPTCWNRNLGLGDTGDHRSHMAFTIDGTVAGECPSGFNERLPQVQLFVRVPNYRGDLYRYQLSDGQGSQWHVDFMNGWAPGKLQEIINGCDFTPGQQPDEYNPPCDCTNGEDGGQNFLTPNANTASAVCDEEVRRLIINEATDNISVLPRSGGICDVSQLIGKSWQNVSPGLFANTCGNTNGGGGGDDEETGGGGGGEEEEEEEEEEDGDEDEEDGDEGEEEENGDQQEEDEEEDVFDEEDDEDEEENGDEDEEDGDEGEEEENGDEQEEDEEDGDEDEEEEDREEEDVVDEEEEEEEEEEETGEWW